MTGSDKHDHDAAWFAALTGDSASSAADREAAALRAAIQSQYAAEMKTLGAGDELALKRLLKRCEAEGLLTAARKPWWRGPALPSWVAIAATLVLSLSLWMKPATTPPGDEIVYRGHDASGAVILVAASPRLAANALRAELAQAGVSASVFQLDETWHLQADLPMPPPQAVKALLQQHALAAPADGRLRIKFVPSRP